MRFVVRAVLYWGSSFFVKVAADRRLPADCRPPYDV